MSQNLIRILCVWNVSRESAVKSFPALTVPPSLRMHGRNGNASRLRVGPLRPRRGPKGIRPRGGTNLGRQRPPQGIAQMFLQPPKQSLLVGRGWQPWNQAFRPSGRKWPPCLPVSRDASRRPIPQVPKLTSPVIATGVLAVERSFPKSHLLASSPVGGCWARRPCHLLVGCDSSDPSHVMEPRGPANHTATAMYPVHGLQSGFGQTDFTLTPAMPDSRSISLPGISLLSGAQPSLSGVRPPPGFTGTPMGSGEFSGSGQTPAIRQAPTLHFGGTRPLPNRTTATITSITAPAVTMASYGGVSTSTSLGRPISSPGIAQNNQVSGPSGQPQQQWSGSIPQGVQLPYTQGTNDIPMEQALNRVFPRGIPAVMEQFLAPTMEPDFGSFRRQSGQSSLDSVISLQELRSDVMARYPGYQVESSDPAPTKPTSLGLANFQQAKPAKEANLPLSPSIEAWLTCQAQAIEGKDQLGKVVKAPLGPKAYPKLPSLKAERFEPSNAPSLLRVGQLPPEWHRLVADQGKISPETISFTRAEFGELQSSVSKMLTVLSDLDWWVAGVSNLAKDIQPHLSQDENLQLAGFYSQRYLLESCRSMEELEIQVTALFSQFKLRERDGYLSRLSPHVPLATRRELRVSPLVGEYLFDEVLVSQAGDRLQGDVACSGLSEECTAIFGICRVLSTIHPEICRRRDAIGVFNRQGCAVCVGLKLFSCFSWITCRLDRRPDSGFSNGDWTVHFGYRR